MVECPKLLFLSFFCISNLMYFGNRFLRCVRVNALQGSSTYCFVLLVQSALVLGVSELCLAVDLASWCFCQYGNLFCSCFCSFNVFAYSATVSLPQLFCDCFATWPGFGRLWLPISRLADDRSVNSTFDNAGNVDSFSCTKSNTDSTRQEEENKVNERWNMMRSRLRRSGRGREVERKYVGSGKMDG